MNYSVLMSVYYKENPVFLKEAINSIFEQTLPSNDFVIVCDGPLTPELDAVLAEAKDQNEIVNVIRLPENKGLGNALNEGLNHCKNEIVARMDSDDISLPDRCKRQLSMFLDNQDLSIISGTIQEFTNDPKVVTGRRVLPEKHEDICRYSKKRTPFNHPAVMFKKSAVNLAGGYKEDFHLFEDYYLWVRMLMTGSIGYNIQDPLLLMRTPNDMYLRRGGKQYAFDMLKFHKWLLGESWIGISDYCTGAIPHALICLMPNWARKTIYKKLHS